MTRRTAGEIARALGATVVGDPGRTIEGLGALDACPGGALTWAVSESKLRAAVAAGLRNVTVVCSAAVEAPDVTCVVAPDPKLAFARAALLITPATPPCVDPRAVVFPCVQLGARVEIRAGAVLGAPGFGYVRVAGGELVPFPQVGRVIVGDDVRIGACSTIDRGALTDTIISRGVKIDNLVHVGHGAVVGEHTAICAAAEVGGHVTVGRACQIGPHACIREGITIGDRAQIGIGAVVVRDVATEAVVAGNPSEPIAVLAARRRALRGLMR